MKKLTSEEEDVLTAIMRKRHNEIYVSYTPYKEIGLESNGLLTQYRRTHYFIGSIDILILEITDHPLESFEIHRYAPGPGKASDDFIELAKTLKTCFELGIPYANNMY